MRKLFFLWFLLYPTTISTNPVSPPQAFISELKFESDGRWILEITFFYDQVFNHEDFDSICIALSSGFSKIKIDNLQDSAKIFVIISDSLVTPLTINNDGDYIAIYSYPKMYIGPLVDSLCFGNYPGSIFDSLPSGYSICRLKYFLFSKDKSPTIGFENDTTGTCGILTGFMYDKNNTLVTSGNFELDNTILFNEDGSYSTQVFSRAFDTHFIYKIIQPGILQTILINNLYINMNPDSSVEKDIHFVNYIVDVNEKGIEQNFELKVINYPNPFNSETNFFVKIPSGLNQQEKQINIYNVNGEKINTLTLLNNSTIQWNGKDQNDKILPSGIYYYQLVIGKKIYKNGSMLLLK